MTLDELRLLDKVIKCKHNMLSDYLWDLEEAKKLIVREIKLKKLIPNVSQETEDIRNAK